MTKDNKGYLSVLLFGCMILVISFGARSSFGLFLPEMTVARGWSREVFSFAFAMQNLVWGIAGSFLG
ncbi:MAG: MFS transporter, partial [Burkholderiaceae bacterium]